MELPVRIGPIQTTVEFTLADREKFEFPVLVGRNLMVGAMVIDVSLANTGGLPVSSTPP